MLLVDTWICTGNAQSHHPKCLEDISRHKTPSRKLLMEDAR